MCNGVFRVSERDSLTCYGLLSLRTLNFRLQPNPNFMTVLSPEERGWLQTWSHSHFSLPYTVTSYLEPSSAEPCWSSVPSEEVSDCFCYFQKKAQLFTNSLGGLGWFFCVSKSVSEGCYSDHFVKDGPLRSNTKRDSCS